MPTTYQELRDNKSLWTSLKGTIEFVCDNCGTIFCRDKKDVYTSLKRSHHIFCSLQCNGAAKTKRGTIQCTCTQCGQIFTKKITQIRSKKGNNFCSQSCAATWNNLHKNHGTRRSKLEVWLEKQLRKRYPALEILFNTKEAINAELDIHFPSLNLAFELNGIYHYEPIHGEEKLASIQSNDHRKFAACAENGISLCIINVSTMRYFKPTKGQKFLDIIADIVDMEIRRRRSA